jgi:hypothetical protein
MNKTHWKIVAAIVAIFAAGAILGAAISTRMMGRRIQRIMMARPDLPVELIVQRLDRELELSAQQRSEVRDALESLRPEFARYRARVAPELHRFSDLAFARVATHLNPGQQQLLSKLQERWNARFATVPEGPQEREPESPAAGQ